MKSNVAYVEFGNKEHSEDPRMDNSKLGHVAIFRSLLSANWAEDTAKFALWVRLLGLATHKPTQVEFGGVSWKLHTGQLVTKAKILARKLKDPKGQEKTEKQVRDMLDFFESEGMISRSGTRHGTVITITNYGQYQSNCEVTKQVTNEVIIKPSDIKASDDSEVVNLVTNKVKQNKKLLEQEVNEQNNNTPLTPQEGNGENADKPKRRTPVRINYQEYLDVYNEEVGDSLPRATVLNDKRKRRFKKLIPKLATPNADGWRAYVRAFVRMAKPWYFGDNPSGWSADIDHLLKEDTLTAVREGKPSLTGR
ncbi:replication protein [Providencia alcalifaciens]|uniref:Replication protein n=1 Tax=Providencia alcalifaciens 205/92 TaxID=1256988 RepID=A0AAV3M7A6_9GAMM|nr:replication protein [Providencia alcalifaciens]EUD11761.1 hypothetical protein HMPREF1563_3371 [Providencia alcalifaciens 205/92]WGZ54992.1 replication protein [Providencia alcalifaciens]